MRAEWRRAPQPAEGVVTTATPSSPAVGPTELDQAAVVVARWMHQRLAEDVATGRLAGLLAVGGLLPAFAGLFGPERAARAFAEAAGPRSPDVQEL